MAEVRKDKPFAELGFGAMRLPLTDPSDRSSIDYAQTAEMIDAFIDAGFNYFDTGWMYCGFKSEKMLGELLTKRYPREAFRIATKQPLKMYENMQQGEELFKKQLENLNVDYFDAYLLHNFDREAYMRISDDLGAWILSKKEAGLTQRIGFSFHDNAEFLDFLLTKYPFMDFVQLQVNYLDWENPGIESRACVEVAQAHGVDVLVMEPVKGGTLANLPDAAVDVLHEIDPRRSLAAWALMFAAQIPGVTAVLSGMSSLHQVEENTALFTAMEPLSEIEQAALKRVAEIMRNQAAIACTGCDYCADACPQSIPISKAFALYNADLQECSSKGWSAHSTYYRNLGQSHGLAADCVKCGLCEMQCPQHLPIRVYLEKVAERFGV